MEIKIDLPFAMIRESNDSNLVTKTKNVLTHADELLRLSELTLNKGKKAELSDYNLVIPEYNRSCFMTFNVLNVPEQLVELDLWKVTRSKIALIKSNIIDPIENGKNGKNANCHWRKNIGLSYQKIKAFSLLVKSLNQILCNKGVFKDNDDGLGEIEPNILNKLPKFEYETFTGHKLSALPKKKLDWSKVTRLECHSKALECSSRVEFKDKYSGHYGVAHKRGFIDEICSHMPSLVQNVPSGHWQNKENCEAEAKKYKTRVKFQNGSPGAYNAALKNNWLDQICQHMYSNQSHNGKFCVYRIFTSKDLYVGITFNYESRMRVHKHPQNTTRSALIIQDENMQHEMLTDYVYTHKDAFKVENSFIQKYADKGYIILNDMKKVGALPATRSKYDKKTLIKLINQCKNISEFKRKHSGAYKAFIKRKDNHKLKKLFGYTQIKWNKALCLKVSATFNTMSQFQLEEGSAYNFAARNNFLDEIRKGMKQHRKPKWYWSFANCQSEAIKFKTRTEFQKKSRGAYKSAYRNKWLDDICSHMSITQDKLDS